MPLIDCPECGKPVSSVAHACPVCGYPVAEKSAAQNLDQREPSAPSEGELLAEVRPSWWGFFWHLFFFWLLVPPVIAYFRRRSTLLRIYPDRLTIERGIISKCYQDYRPRDIRSIDVDQNLLQRIVGIGDMTVSTSATVEASEELKAVPDPHAIRELILAQRK